MLGWVHAWLCRAGQENLISTSMAYSSRSPTTKATNSGNNSAVEACLLHCLKKRALGLFKYGSTMALLQKLSKVFEPAAEVSKLVSDMESPSSTELSGSRKSLDNNKNQTKKSASSVSTSPKFLWLRIAIFHKKLAKILDYLVQNSSKYYEVEALIADPVDGPIFASLLVGPCALDYTKMKTSDHFWTDPPADELVQRHRIHSGNHGFSSPGSPKRQGLQNSKLTLLYGKNNVLVQPENKEALAGYLSLHQSSEGLIIMWTPNQLMNGCCEDSRDETDRSQYWEFAMTIYLDEVVYIHCHQQPDCRGTVVLVGQDGVQRPPIHFPKGGHLLSFLSCLETGLQPNGQLDPPLWSQKGKGKVFPKLRRKGSRLSSSTSSSSSSTTSMEEEEATDYVFRIIASFKPDMLTPEMLDPKAPRSPHLSRGSPTSSGGQIPPVAAPAAPDERSPWPVRRQLPPSPLVRSSVQAYALSQEEQNSSCLVQASNDATHRNHIKQLCDIMTKQIISRAFYGWLAHCRHLKTVRTHLSGLVYHVIVAQDDPIDASDGLTIEAWDKLCCDGIVRDSGEVYRRVYYGGVSHELRKQVWPYLLGHYKFGSTFEEREELEAVMGAEYEKVMSEWLAVEAIIRQRDKETVAANLAKLSQESTDGHIPLVRKDSSLSNEVFVSFESEELSRPETVVEESSTARTTPSSDRKTSMELSITAPSTSSVGGTDRAVGTETPPMAILKKDGIHKGFSHGQESPDDGLGGSFARGESIVAETERPKTDSVGDSGILTPMTPRSLPADVADRIQMSAKLSVDSAVEDGGSMAGGLDSSSSVGGNKSRTGSATDEGEQQQQQQQQQGVSSVISNKTEGGLTVDKCGGSGARIQDYEDALVSSDASDHLSASKESLLSPASPASNGGIYSAELLDSVALNLHRIDKDVQRCDRNYHYFTPENLEKLRNIMCTYVWQNLDTGYVQGMCDLVAPLLVIFDDESLAYSCFCQLMKRMSCNFPPHGGAMDTHFANMRSLIQILDSELFEHMHLHGDYTHFYFCYRWFLLDFKRELIYDDVFSVWETIWAAKHMTSSHFVLFIALALVQVYRDIILDNNMDFTDIIKFFNEMAERHNAKQVLKIARELILRLQTLIDNK
ncbi:small G protein signaling modulator 1 [Plakobranchus ocellatus]|uniref:Small G protein signaling modulator 1 n=1 Tax=Plakobranchus ocellatus TaxID=259542 RepID=A0AAV4A1H5_9GAST|nr:small G protein signaling modulator 1 [Plakobranchus ocellatus]